MKQIAILGFGIVGGGIPTVLAENAEQIRLTVGDDVNIRYILDLREFPDSPGTASSTPWTRFSRIRRLRSSARPWAG